MRSLRLGCSFLAVCLLAAAPGLGVVSCVSQPKEPLRLGVNAWPPFELLYLAQERGFFKDEGVEVDLCDFSSYTGILRAYHKGNIDGFLATLNEVMISDNFQDIPAVVLVADYSFGADALIARDGIAGPAALRGRTIAFEESALGSYMLERVLDSGGLRADQVKVLNKLPEEGSQAFRRGEVDALITYQPDLGKLLREKGAHVVFSSHEIPGEIVDVMALRENALSERAPEVRRLVKAWFRALGYLEEHPDEAAATMAKRQGVSIEEFLQGLKGAHIPDLAENRALFGTAQEPGPLHRSVSRLASFLIRHGLAKSTFSAGDLFHTEIVESD
jgi:NitT/TauT family transport system substrate-binding protein